MRQQWHLEVATPADVHRVRRHAEQLARSAGLGDGEVSNCAIIATELARNLDQHAREGAVLMRALSPQEPLGIELFAFDRGPGMDPARCLEDGYSTRGTSGTGLGAIKRLASRFSIDSSEGGTVVAAQVCEPGSSPTFLLGAAYRPRPGELACGDGWSCRSFGDVWRLILLDGLGHGPKAEYATMEALDVFDAVGAEPIETLMQRLHQALVGTRGAAAAIADVDLASGTLSFLSIGNVAGVVIDRGHEQRPLLAHAGTLGAALRPHEPMVYEMGPGSTFVMHTDGIAHRFDSADVCVADLPSLGAARLIREVGRDRDDAAVVVVKRGGSDGT